MAGKLLLRFDDICPTMNWTVWDKIEQVLCDTGVKPLLAIIPDNKDVEFHLTPPKRNFWDRVRCWNALGWTIGVHGYQHRYITQSPGLLGIHKASEFAGLPFQEQERKITLALKIFRGEGLQPSIWVAPGHSFDAVTLDVLSSVGLKAISDGFSLMPYEDGNGIVWIPQQMWRFRRIPFGVWTVCLHHNSWGPESVERFRNQLAKYRRHVSSFEDVVSHYRRRRRGATDSASAVMLGCLLRLKLQLRPHSPVSSTGLVADH